MTTPIDLTNSASVHEAVRAKYAEAATKAESGCCGPDCCADEPGVFGPDLPIVTGGRSSGARVACRTATATGAAGVLCLAFPLHPPRRRPDAELKTRLPELELVKVPVLIVQGERDPFGMPPAARRRKVVVVPGDHSLKSGVRQVGPAVSAFLKKVIK